MKSVPVSGRNTALKLFIFIMLILTCTAKNPLFVEGDWISDIPFIINHVHQEFGHDNRIFESDHFLTFSDASEDETKKRFATQAENALDDLLAKFKIKDAAALGITGRDTKITIYTNKASGISQLAFPYGFILDGEDNPVFENWPREMQKRYPRQVTHETMHVLQFLLGVLPNADNSLEPDKWFNEGIAETAGGGFFIPITSQTELDRWKSRYNAVNPVSIHQWSDLTIPSNEVGAYYPMFGLAVRYLLDRKGLDKSYTDVKNMFLELAGLETTFADAFEKYMGISLTEYESSFFQRMDDFLN